MRAFITFSIFSFIALACIAYWLLNASNEPILLSPSEVTTFSSQPLQTSLLDIDSNDDGALPVKRSDQELNTKDSARAKERELLSSLPRSLRGTDVNGGFQVDEEGHLIIASSNRDFFEYFLSALGEESLEQVTDRMIELITLGLEPPAEGEAIALLHNYIAMKRAMQDLESQVGEGLSQYGQTSIDQHRARLDMVSAVRRQYLGDEAADAFYGESEGYDQYMMSKMAITSDKSLSDKQRAEAMVHLMEQAPQSVKPRLEDEYKMQRLRLEVATLKEDGAGE
jgi:lipase chaperone LimK